MSNRLCLDTCT